MAAPLAPAVASGILANWPVAAVVAPVAAMHEWGLSFEITELSDDDEERLLEMSKHLAFSARHVEEMHLRNCWLDT